MIATPGEGKKMRKFPHLTTRNVVETAIDVSKDDKSSTWESIARRIHKEAAQDQEKAGKEPAK